LILQSDMLFFIELMQLLWCSCVKVCGSYFFHWVISFLICSFTDRPLNNYFNSYNNFHLSSFLYLFIKKILTSFLIVFFQKILSWSTQLLISIKYPDPQKMGFLCVLYSKIWFEKIQCLLNFTWSKKIFWCNNSYFRQKYSCYFNSFYIAPY
jgi:hypothetical protein